MAKKAGKIHWRTRRKMEAEEKAKQEAEQKQNGMAMTAPSSFPAFVPPTMDQLYQKVNKLERKNEGQQEFMASIASQMRNIADQIEAFIGANRGY